MITMQHLQQRWPCLRIDDLAFFGSKQSDDKTVEFFGRWLAEQPWFRSLANSGVFGNIGDDIPHDGIIGARCMTRLHSAYADAKRRGSKAGWLRYIPPKFRQLLDRHWWITEGDVYKIIPCVDHAGFGFVVEEGGLIEDTDLSLCLGRLGGIRQLASLHSPIVTDCEVREYPMEFDHSRYAHSLGVSAFTTLIGVRCGLSREDLALVRVAAESHDALTPAGGDTIKAIDPDAFDEDKHYPTLFERPGWPSLRDRYGLCPTKLTQTILGQGLLGRILDAADKLSYTGTDVREFLRRNSEGHFVWEEFPELYDRIQSLLRGNPNPCSVWECAEQRNGELVFTDKDRFADFMRLRALMFRILYANASARFMEAGFVAELAKILYDDGTLTRASLLSMGDQQLFYIMSEALGGYSATCLSHVIYHADPRVEAFETQLETLEFERTIVKTHPETMTRFERSPKPSVGCLKTFKVVAGGKVLPFNEACPFDAWDIEQIFIDPKPFKVFVYNLPPICPNQDMRRRLLKSRDQRIAKKQ